MQGKTGVQHADREDASREHYRLVVSIPSECACYVMQQLNIAGRCVLAFYDSGANSNIVEYDLVRETLVSIKSGSRRSLST
jgi:hypothetical protein